MWVHGSTSPDPVTNLALEDVVLSRGEELGPGLLFYRNGPCVVVGKNQNPWRECDVPWCREEGLPIARRISGGGTVVHDPGTLNYCMVWPRVEYKSEVVFEEVLGALEGLGLAVKLEQGNSIFAGDKKVSGNAFCYRGQWVLHHGTFLIEADLRRLRRALARSSLPEMRTRAVASRPAKVGNLTEFMPKLNATMITRALIERMERRFGRPEPLGVAAGEVEETAKRIGEWDWRFGCTPRFEVTLEGEGAKLEVAVEKGRVAEARLVEGEGVQMIESWRGWAFAREVLAETLRGVGLEAAMGVLSLYRF
ncbi:MAG TPA: lipoate--protein ligase family protein [Kiritimatiellia bacterium]|nr:lipoate--protein ligase family protein [Kiritimatiellia bacterium]